MNWYYVIGVLQPLGKGDHRHVGKAARGNDPWEAVTKVANQELGISGTRDEVDDIDQLEKLDLNFWVLAVVELKPGLPVVVGADEPTGPYALDKTDKWIVQNDVFGTGAAPLPTWVVAGDDYTGSDIVQRLHAPANQQKVGGIQVAIEGAMVKALDMDEFYTIGFVIEQDGYFYAGTPETGELRKIHGVGRDLHTPAGPQSSLNVINRHRAKLGQARLDPVAAGWTQDDLELEAARIRAIPNPGAYEKLKRSLMR